MEKYFMFFSHILVILFYALTPAIFANPLPHQVEPTVRQIASHQLHSHTIPFDVLLPTTWIRLTPNELQLEHFFIYDQDFTATFSISRLNSTSFDLMQNINRWRNQIGLTRVKQYPHTTLKSALGPITQVEMVNQDQVAIVVQLLQKDDQIFFLKFQGDHDLIKTLSFPILMPITATQNSAI